MITFYLSDLMPEHFNYIILGMYEYLCMNNIINSDECIRSFDLNDIEYQEIIFLSYRCLCKLLLET